MYLSIFLCLLFCFFSLESCRASLWSWRASRSSCCCSLTFCWRAVISCCSCLPSWSQCLISCCWSEGTQVKTFQSLLLLFCKHFLVPWPWNFQHMWAMVWGFTARWDFWIPPVQPAPGSKWCLQSRSGGLSAYFTASFAKHMFLGMVKEVIYSL